MLCILTVLHWNPANNCASTPMTSGFRSSLKSMFHDYRVSGLNTLTYDIILRPHSIVFDIMYLIYIFVLSQASSDGNINDFFLHSCRMNFSKEMLLWWRCLKQKWKKKNSSEFPRSLYFYTVDFFFYYNS